MPNPHEEVLARVAARAAQEALARAKPATQIELERVALAAAKEAVRETHAELFALLGVNIGNFDDMQRLRANLEFLNSWHKSTAAAATKVMLLMVTLFASGIIGAVWLGIRAALKR